MNRLVSSMVNASGAPSLPPSFRTSSSFALMSFSECTLIFAFVRDNMLASENGICFKATLVVNMMCLWEQFLPSLPSTYGQPFARHRLPPAHLRLPRHLILKSLQDIDHGWSFFVTEVRKFANFLRDGHMIYRRIMSRQLENFAIPGFGSKSVLWEIIFLWKALGTAKLPWNGKIFRCCYTK